MIGLLLFLSCISTAETGVDIRTPELYCNTIKLIGSNVVFTSITQKYLIVKDQGDQEVEVLLVDESAKDASSKTCSTAEKYVKVRPGSEAITNYVLERPISVTIEGGQFQSNISLSIEEATTDIYFNGDISIRSLTLNVTKPSEANRTLRLNPQKLTVAEGVAITTSGIDELYFGNLDNTETGSSINATAKSLKITSLGLTTISICSPVSQSGGNISSVCRFDDVEITADTIENLNIAHPRNSVENKNQIIDSQMTVNGLNVTINGNTNTTSNLNIGGASIANTEKIQKVSSQFTAGNMTLSQNGGLNINIGSVLGNKGSSVVSGNTIVSNTLSICYNETNNIKSTIRLGSAEDEEILVGAQFNKVEVLCRDEKSCSMDVNIGKASKDQTNSASITSLFVDCDLEPRHEESSIAKRPYVNMRSVTFKLLGENTNTYDLGLLLINSTATFSNILVDTVGDKIPFSFVSVHPGSVSEIINTIFVDAEKIGEAGFAKINTRAFSVYTYEPNGEADTCLIRDTDLTEYRPIQLVSTGNNSISGLVKSNNEPMEIRQGDKLMNVKLVDKELKDSADETKILLEPEYWKAYRTFYAKEGETIMFENASTFVIESLIDEELSNIDIFIMPLSHIASVTSEGETTTLEFGSSCGTVTMYFKRRNDINFLFPKVLSLKAHLQVFHNATLTIKELQSNGTVIIDTNGSKIAGWKKIDITGNVEMDNGKINISQGLGSEGGINLRKLKMDLDLTLVDNCSTNNCVIDIKDSEIETGAIKTDYPVQESEGYVAGISLDIGKEDNYIKVNNLTIGERILSEIVAYVSCKDNEDCRLAVGGLVEGNPRLRVDKPVTIWADGIRVLMDYLTVKDDQKKNILIEGINKPPLEFSNLELGEPGHIYTKDAGSVELRRIEMKNKKMPKVFITETEEKVIEDDFLITRDETKNYPEVEIVVDSKRRKFTLNHNFFMCNNFHSEAREQSLSTYNLFSYDLETRGAQNTNCEPHFSVMKVTKPEEEFVCNSQSKNKIFIEIGDVYMLPIKSIEIQKKNGDNFNDMEPRLYKQIENGGIMLAQNEECLAPGKYVIVVERNVQYVDKSDERQLVLSFDITGTNMAESIKEQYFKVVYDSITAVGCNSHFLLLSKDALVNVDASTLVEPKLTEFKNAFKKETSDLQNKTLMFNETMYSPYNSALVMGIFEETKTGIVSADYVFNLGTQEMCRGHLDLEGVSDKDPYAVDVGDCIELMQNKLITYLETQEVPPVLYIIITMTTESDITLTSTRSYYLVSPFSVAANVNSISIVDKAKTIDMSIITTWNNKTQQDYGNGELRVIYECVDPYEGQDYKYKYEEYGIECGSTNVDIVHKYNIEGEEYPLEEEFRERLAYNTLYDIDYDTNTKNALTIYSTSPSELLKHDDLNLEYKLKVPEVESTTMSSRCPFNFNLRQIFTCKDIYFEYYANAIENATFKTSIDDIQLDITMKGKEINNFYPLIKRITACQSFASDGEQPLCLDYRTPNDNGEIAITNLDTLALFVEVDCEIRYTFGTTLYQELESGVETKNMNFSVSVIQYNARANLISGIIDEGRKYDGLFNGSRRVPTGIDSLQKIQGVETNRFEVVLQREMLLCEIIDNKCLFSWFGTIEQLRNANINFQLESTQEFDSNVEYKGHFNYEEEIPLGIKLTSNDNIREILLTNSDSGKSCTILSNNELIRVPDNMIFNFLISLPNKYTSNNNKDETMVCSKLFTLGDNEQLPNIREERTIQARVTDFKSKSVYLSMNIGMFSKAPEIEKADYGFVLNGAVVKDIPTSQESVFITLKDSFKYTYKVLTEIYKEVDGREEYVTSQIDDYFPLTYPGANGDVQQLEVFINNVNESAKLSVRIIPLHMEACEGLQLSDYLVGDVQPELYKGPNSSLGGLQIYYDPRDRSFRDYHLESYKELNLGFDEKIVLSYPSDLSIELSGLRTLGESGLKKCIVECENVVLLEEEYEFFKELMDRKDVLSFNITKEFRELTGQFGEYEEARTFTINVHLISHTGIRSTRTFEVEMRYTKTKTEIKFNYELDADGHTTVSRDRDIVMLIERPTDEVKIMACTIRYEEETEECNQGLELRPMLTPDDAEEISPYVELAINVRDYKSLGIPAIPEGNIYPLTLTIVTQDSNKPSPNFSTFIINYLNEICDEGGSYIVTSEGCMQCGKRQYSNALHSACIDYTIWESYKVYILVGSVVCVLCIVCASVLGARRCKKTKTAKEKTVIIRTEPRALPEPVKPTTPVVSSPWASILDTSSESIREKTFVSIPSDETSDILLF